MKRTMCVCFVLRMLLLLIPRNSFLVEQNKTKQNNKVDQVEVIMMEMVWCVYAAYEIRIGKYLDFKLLDI